MCITFLFVIWIFQIFSHDHNGHGHDGHGHNGHNHSHNGHAKAKEVSKPVSEKASLTEKARQVSLLQK